MPFRLIVFSIGQAVTAFGSALTTFGLGIWIFKSSGSVSVFALGMVFYTLPGAILSPYIGRLVDRFDKKRLALAADTMLALCTLSYLLLYRSDFLTITAIYSISMLASVAFVLKYSCLASMMPLLVGRERLLRANGFMSIGSGIANTVAPILAALMITTIGLSGLMLLDLMAYLVGFLSYSAVKITSNQSQNKDQARPSPWAASYIADVLVVWKFLNNNLGKGLLVVYMASQNVLMAMIGVLTIPMMLAMFTESELGVMMSLLSLGGLVGAVVVSLMPTRKYVKRILFGNMVMGIAIVFFGASTHLTTLYIAGFIVLFSGRMIETCERSYWQESVPADIQGRFFSLRAAVDLSILPLAAIISGVIVEYFLEPSMQVGGGLAVVFGDWIGVGDGRGIGLIFLFAGTVHVSITIAAILYRGLHRPIAPRLYANDETECFSGENL